MPERAIRGVAASPGVATGPAWLGGPQIQGGALIPEQHRDGERLTALTALAAAAESLRAVAADLAAQEAEIVEAGVLMAQDPALIRAVERAVSEGRSAPDAIILATGEQADLIAAIGDETLAVRADDVRSLGRRAARLTGDREVGDGKVADRAARDDGAAGALPGDLPGIPPDAQPDMILIAADLGPADVAELAPSLAGVGLVGGGATAHAAIVARSLGVPMVTGLDPEVLEIDDGTPVVLDGSAGCLILEPSGPRARAAAGEMGSRRRASERASDLRDQPAVTVDGKRISVLVNVATPEELGVGVRAGAEGIGLLRTELAFLQAVDWPTEQEHRDLLLSILPGLEGRPAVVRVLDFGADKSPPFLARAPERGLELLLAHRPAFIRQLRAILFSAQSHDVRIMLPMVDTPEQLVETRSLLEQVADARGVERIPPLGAMIETPAAAQNAYAIASASDFLSIGTNDLTAATLGADRFAANTASAQHPRVLRSIARSVGAAHEAGIAIEVCGEAASDPVMVPLLVGLGVDELSVGAARVGEVRGWIRQLSAAECAELARSALTMDTAEEVKWAAQRVAAELAGGRPSSQAGSASPGPRSTSAQPGDRGGERVQGVAGVSTFGA